MTGRVAACQFEPVVDDVEANVDRIDDLAAGTDAEVAVFPELALTGYDLDAAAERAAPVPGPLTDPLVDVAAERDTHLVVGLPERAGESLYDALVYVSPQGVRATYRKQHRWGEQGDVFEAGEESVTVESPAGRLGCLLGYDLNFPEVGLAYASRDVDVLAVGAAWRGSYREDWQLVARTRALDGPAYVVAANHTGDQRGREHLGGSRVVDPRGTVVEAADRVTTAAVATRVDAETLDAARDRNPVRRTRVAQSMASEAGPETACLHCSTPLSVRNGTYYCAACGWCERRPAD